MIFVHAIQTCFPKTNKTLLKFGRPKISVQVRGCVRFLVTLKFIESGVVSTSPNIQSGGPHPVGCPRLLIQYIRSYPPYLEAVCLYLTWGRATLWWKGPIVTIIQYTFSYNFHIYAWIFQVSPILQSFSPKFSMHLLSYHAHHMLCSPCRTWFYCLGKRWIWGRLSL